MLCGWLGGLCASPWLLRTCCCCHCTSFPRRRESSDFALSCCPCSKAKGTGFPPSRNDEQNAEPPTFAEGRSEHSGRSAHHRLPSHSRHGNDTSPSAMKSPLSTVSRWL